MTYFAFIMSCVFVWGQAGINDLVDAQGSFSDPDKALNSCSEESKDYICSSLSSDSEDYISSLEGEGSETEDVST